MSHVVNQRMGKRQPMCWTAEGAHLLLQVRRAVLDGRLDALFRARYPRFRLTSRLCITETCLRDSGVVFATQ